MPWVEHTTTSLTLPYKSISMLMYTFTNINLPDIDIQALDVLYAYHPKTPAVAQSTETSVDDDVLTWDLDASTAYHPKTPAETWVAEVLAWDSASGDCLPVSDPDDPMDMATTRCKLSIHCKSPLILECCIPC